MTIEEQIAALIAKAEPLRLLPDEKAEALGLPGIVEQINALRFVEANGTSLTPEQLEEQKHVARAIEDNYGRKPLPGEVEYFTGVVDQAPKRRGRPPKVAE